MDIVYCAPALVYYTWVVASVGLTCLSIYIWFMYNELYLRIQERSPIEEPLLKV